MQPDQLLNEISEKELNERIISGDVEALAELVRRNWSDLLNTIEEQLDRRVVGRTSPEDVLQDVSIFAVSKFRDIDFSETCPLEWLNWHSRLRAIDASREHLAGKRDVGVDVEVGRADTQVVVGKTKLDDNTDLKEAVVAALKTDSPKSDQLNLLLGGMSEIQITVLNLRFIEDLPTKEIATRLGKTDGATRVLLSRTMSKLTDRVETLRER